MFAGQPRELARSAQPGQRRDYHGLFHKSSLFSHDYCHLGPHSYPARYMHTVWNSRAYASRLHVVSHIHRYYTVDRVGVWPDPWGHVH